MAKQTLSKTQIDRLGERLKAASTEESDLRLLDEYRVSFGPAYADVAEKIAALGLAVTGRRAKSTQSILEKLRRESVRLSQMQDIAGCRIVVSDTKEQEEAVGKLRVSFPGAVITDRRAKPSHGYRAVHIIAMACGRPIEIQVRTVLQHLWAELSERASDVVDAKIKYGGGPEVYREILVGSSETVALQESSEAEVNDAVAAVVRAHDKLGTWLSKPMTDEQNVQINGLLDAIRRLLPTIAERRREVGEMRVRTARMLEQMIKWVEARRSKEQKI